METALNKAEIEEKYATTYRPLVDGFCNDKKVRGVAAYPFNGHNYVPAPFLPIIGSGYYQAPIRVAIFGMETLHWHDLSNFIQKYDAACKQGTDPLAVLKRYTDGNDDGTKIDAHGDHQRFHVHHGYEYWVEKKNAYGFWTFAFSTLASIYSVSSEEEITEKKVCKEYRNDLRNSFIWGNVNAYEKYEATWEKLKSYIGGKKNKKKDWRTIFEATECFNSAQLIIPYTRPHILVVFYGKDTKNENWFKDWLAGDVKTLVEPIPIPWEKFPKYDNLTKKNLMEMLSDNIHCYKCSGTYVLHTLHPGNMWRGRKGSKAENWKAAINFAIREMTDNFSFYFNS